MCVCLCLCLCACVCVCVFVYLFVGVGVRRPLEQSKATSRGVRGCVCVSINGLHSLMCACVMVFVYLCILMYVSWSMSDYKCSIHYTLAHVNVCM